MTITGSGFTFLSTVHFGAQEAFVRSHTATSITVEPPAGSGSVYVTVTTPYGTSPATGKGKVQIQEVKDAGARRRAATPASGDQAVVLDRE